ncbi:MAG TPA: LytTR family DNA-binding domain-containing protein [Chitinophagaceae bacterium]|nr:LytTR family DNA-binding domain-containing protein [Chitinophagaceae bacterium]HNF70917.1 LytTR family DNA-binding domain-containing protein [Chitinophagaceae bacterium]
MMKAIALDDEPLALNVIESFCADNDKVQLVKTFIKPNDAVRYIENFPVDLLFLDIQMPSVSGIEFFKNLKRDVMVIFTTAHSEYAIEGFNLNAVDYLLKPFTHERFNQAIQKAYDYYTYQNNAGVTKQPFIYIRADYSLLKIDLADIIYIEGLNDYLRIHLKNQRPVVARMTLKSLYEKLPAGDFLRVHRSYIVSTLSILKITGKVIHIKVNEQVVPLQIGKSYEEEVYRVCKM